MLCSFAYTLMFAFVVMFFCFALDTGWNLPIKLIEGAVSKVVLGKKVGVFCWFIKGAFIKSLYLPRFLGSFISSILQLDFFLLDEVVGAL